MDNPLEKLCSAIRNAHPEEFTVELFVEEICLNYDHTYDHSQHALTIMARSYSDENLDIRPDGVILSALMTPEPVVVNSFMPGWRNMTAMLNHRAMKIELTVQSDFESLVEVYKQAEFCRRIRVFNRASQLIHVMDWITSREARVPRTVTMLPWKVALQQSERWMDLVNARNQRQILNRPSGTRENVGHFTLLTPEPQQTYDIQWLKDTNALMEESRLQHHCVWMYEKAVEKNQSVILHVRNRDRSQPNDRWTVEITLQQVSGKSGKFNIVKPKIRQFQGIHNKNVSIYLYGAVEELLRRSTSTITNDSTLDVESIKNHLAIGAPHNVRVII